MNSEAIKTILLESLKAAEKTVENDLKNDDETKRTVQYLLHFFKFLGIDTIEKLAFEGKAYVQNQVQQGIESSTKIIAKVVSSLMTLIITFLAVSVGLIFGAVALSLWLGSYFGSSALGFLIAGTLWIVLALTFTKLLLTKEKLAKVISKKIDVHHLKL